MSFETFRKPILDRFKAVWLTFESYKLLREQKKIQEKTIAQLVDDLIMERYGYATLTIAPSHEASSIEQNSQSDTNI